MKKKYAAVVLLTGVLMLNSCAANNSDSSKATVTDDIKSSGSVFAMDTYMTITAYGQNGKKGIEAAQKEITKLEKLWSVTDENSEIYTLDHSGGTEVPVSAETEELLNFAIDMHWQTKGALDITLYPVLRAWGFTTGEYCVPDDSEISALLECKGVERISVGNGKAYIPKNTEIDLGAVAKGCAGDAAAKALKEHGVTSALLDLGGNIQTIGDAKPDGTKWKVGIRDPFGEGSIGTLAVGECAVITSGGYERFFEKDGVIYKHILDPETGRPADSGLASVTVIGKEGRLCDALSTSLYVMGLDDACAYWRDSVDLEMILISDDGGVYVTEGIAENFSPKVENVTVIER
ncbi:FAD:protein FMN transferase [Ruminococcus albus]|uniref:FAD:protein FMN transferase n=1 Tax=Ruminococcus albus TaxID=1264 RepID=A0A1H7NMD6_RUMAL|nr:FAD:protein FMN transferase [Ruminococcus albus]SEL24469.1 thiamine biosynthesis lipoprotein [Ruminococcus albus]